MRVPGSRASTGWYAVLALALVAALAAATVVGAGLSLWRGSPAQRAVAVPSGDSVLNGSGVVTVPATPSPAAHQPQAPGPTPPAPGVVTTVIVRQHTAASGSRSHPHSNRPSSPANRPGGPSVTLTSLLRQLGIEEHSRGIPAARVAALIRQRLSPQAARRLVRVLAVRVQRAAAQGATGSWPAVHTAHATPSENEYQPGHHSKAGRAGDGEHDGHDGHHGDDGEGAQDD